MQWSGNNRVIVAATDGSEPSLRAARMAASIATANGAKLYLITVVRPPEGWWGIGGAPPTAKSVSEAIVSAQKEVLDQAIAQLDLAEVDFETVEELGDPATMIISLCTDSQADLLVIGRRGAGLIERFVMGSVADRLAHYAPCPVLIVP